MKALPPPKPNEFDGLKDPPPIEDNDRTKLRLALLQAIAAETYQDTRELIIEGIMAYNQDATIDEEWLAAVLGVFEDGPCPT